MPDIPPLCATVIGSWSFPGWYAKFCADVAEHPEAFGADDKAEAVRDATRLAIDDQLRAGLELISDGEMQRVDFNLGFYDYLTGIEPLQDARKWGAPAHDQRSRYRCVAPLAAPHGLGCVAEFERFRELSHAPVKMPVPGPFTLAGCIDGDTVYPDRDAVAEALLPIVNRELRDLEAAGAIVLQLDEPSFSCRPQDPERFLDVIARTTLGVNAYVSLHMCFGNYRGRAVGRRSYRPLFPHLARAAVDELALEFASREMSEIELAAEIKPPMALAVGLIDVKNSWVEPVDFVAERIREVVKYIEPERLRVTPDCGFSQTARFLACRKAAALADGVRAARKALGLKDR